MRLLLGAVLGVACGFLSVLGRPPRAERQGRGGWDSEPAPEPDLNPNRWTSHTWGGDTWNGAESHGNNHQGAQHGQGDHTTSTGNLGTGQWDDSYWWQQRWWDDPGSWIPAGWTAGYWDGQDWSTPTWMASSSSSSSTRWGDRGASGWNARPQGTEDSSSRGQSQPPWDDSRHLHEGRPPREDQRAGGEQRDRGWLRPEEERPVGFYRLGVFIPRRRDDHEERFHRGGAGDVRMGRKEARARAWREGTFRPSSFWHGMAAGVRHAGDGANFAEVLNRHLVPRDHDFEYGVDWHADGLPALPLWAVPGMWPSPSSSTTTTTSYCSCPTPSEVSSGMTSTTTSSLGAPPFDGSLDIAPDEEDTVNLMQQPPPGGGNANDGATGAPVRRSFHLSEEEIQGFLEAGWPQAVVDNVVEFCDYLEDVATRYGMEAVAWGGGAWIDSLTVANATVELVQETIIRRLRGVPEARPAANATRGRLMVGWAGFQRVVSDFHQSLIAEGLREHWLPSRIDGDGRRLEDPPFVRGTRGDHDLWAQVRARELARALVAQGRRDAAVSHEGTTGTASSAEPAPQVGGVHNAEHVPVATSDADIVEADENEETGGMDSDDEGVLMQVSLEEEARLHRHNVQNEARRHLRTLLLSLEHIQQRGEGPEYRWGVQQLLRAYDMADEVVGVFRDILQRRVSGGQPYFPIVREPPFGPLRSRVLSWMGEFRFMLTRALSEELLLQLQELGRVSPAGMASGSDGEEQTAEGTATLASLLRVPRRSRSRSPRGGQSSGGGTSRHGPVDPVLPSGRASTAGASDAPEQSGGLVTGRAGTTGALDAPEQSDGLVPGAPAAHSAVPGPDAAVLPAAGGDPASLFPAAGADPDGGCAAGVCHRDAPAEPALLRRGGHAVPAQGVSLPAASASLSEGVLQISDEAPMTGVGGDGGIAGDLGGSAAGALPPDEVDVASSEGRSHVAVPEV